MKETVEENQKCIIVMLKQRVACLCVVHGGCEPTSQGGRCQKTFREGHTVPSGGRSGVLNKSVLVLCK